jgi:hypothetical protein
MAEILNGDKDYDSMTPGEPKPYASEVADNILNNQVSDYDINDLMTVEEQAECFRELVGIWASREHDSGGLGRELAKMDIIDLIGRALKNSAIAKGYHE